MEEYYFLNERDHPQPPQIDLIEYENKEKFKEAMLSKNPITTTDLNQYNGLISYGTEKEFGLNINSDTEKALKKAKQFLEGEKPVNYTLYPSKISEQGHILIKTKKLFKDAGTTLEAGFLETPQGIQYTIKLGKKTTWASKNRYPTTAINKAYNLAAILNEETEATLSNIQTEPKKPTENTLI